MATNIPINVSDNTEHITLRVTDRSLNRSLEEDSGSPYYVGARAYVTQLEDGAEITVIDKEGTTTATVYNGADGQDGQDGQDGADGAAGADGFSPTATVEKVGDTATITITDKNGTTTASVSDGGGGASAFVAEYGVTTYADVKDAYDNDAILICTVDDSGNTMVLQLVYFDDTNEIFFFAFPTSDGWHWTQISNADGWDDGVFYFASTDTATQLADGLMSALDKQKLDGLSKRNIWYGTCSTSASQSPKSITTASGDFSLTNGSMLVVKFSNTNSLSSASLQVDGGTAKAVYQLDGTSNIANRWGGGEVVMFAYDGTKFILLDQSTASTTQYGITKLNNTVTSTSTSEAATANAVKAAYDHGGVTSVNGSTGAVTVTVPTITDTYDGTSSNGMSGKAVKSAIDALDGTVSGSAGSGKTLTAFSQTDGKVSATFGSISITKSQVSDFPTAVSSFTNDAGYITDYTETDPIFSASAAAGISSSDISDWNGKSTVSVTRHTTTGTNIADLTIDGTTTKLYAPTGGGGGITDVEVDGTSVVSGGVAEIDLTGKSDVGHTHTTSAITDFPALADVATTGDYDDLTNQPTIPANVSELVNDAGYMTDAIMYVNLTKSGSVYTADKTYAEIVAAINGGLMVYVNYNTYAHGYDGNSGTTYFFSSRIIETTQATQTDLSLTPSGWSEDSYVLTSTDTKLAITAVTSGTTYYPIVATNSTAAATRQYDRTGIVYKGTNGTTNTVGSAVLTLGNSTASGSSGNKRGQLVIYGSTAYAHTIQGAPTAARTLTLPNDTGTIALTSDIPTVPTNVSAFTNDAGYITGYTETDPTVPSWAKEASKPSYTASEVGALADDSTPSTLGIADYIVEQSTSGDWIYRKWNSGVAECWATKTITAATNSSDAGGYVSASAATPSTFPFTFTAVPNVQVTCNSGTITGSVTCAGSPSTTSAGSWKLYRHNTNAGTNDKVFMFYVIGKWK